MNDFDVSFATSIESMRCSSLTVPSVTDTRARVCPRVNSAAPWGRGSTLPPPPPPPPVGPLANAALPHFQPLPFPPPGHPQRPAPPHPDRVPRAGHRQAPVRKLELLERGIGDPPPFDAPPPHRRDRALPR